MNYRKRRKGYNALHEWITKRKSKPKVCEHCKCKKKLGLANISQKYYKDINDFIWLCASCHRKMDWKINKKIRKGFLKNKSKFVNSGIKNRFKKGHVPWNKGKPINLGKNNPFYGKKHSNKTKKLISKLITKWHKKR